MRHIRRIIDPVGVELHSRRRRLCYNPGPNFLWCVDGYDTLKSYGLCVHGAVDGFPTHVILLHAYTTNSDLAVIGGYFMDEWVALNGSVLTLEQRTHT